jgi:hypothetical protein
LGFGDGVYLVRNFIFPKCLTIITTQDDQTAFDLSGCLNSVIGLTEAAGQGKMICQELGRPPADLFFIKKTSFNVKMSKCSHFRRCWILFGHPSHFTLSIVGLDNYSFFFLFFSFLFLKK